MKRPNQNDDIDIIVGQWQAQGLSTDFDALQISARILRLGKSLQTRLGKLHADFNLKAGEFDVLAALKRAPEPALTPSQLYQTMLLSSGAMTSRLDRLESKQLIQRQHCKQDRRSIRVSLTDKGRALIDEIYPLHFDLLQSLFSTMADNDKARLSALLKTCLQQFEPHSGTH